MTYTPPVVAPPAPLPWDLPAITAAALEVLRLDPTDVDVSRIDDAAAQATALIDEHLDYETEPATIPVPVVGAAVQVTVELYRRKDAPFGVTDAWTVDGALVRLSSDPLRGVRAMLAPYRARRGLA